MKRLPLLVFSCILAFAVCHSQEHEDGWQHLAQGFDKLEQREFDQSFSSFIRARGLALDTADSKLLGIASNQAAFLLALNGKYGLAREMLASLPEKSRYTAHPQNLASADPVHVDTTSVENVNFAIGAVP